jgi:A/G-specific adenine glycosylase
MARHPTAGEAFLLAGMHAGADRGILYGMPGHRCPSDPRPPRVRDPDDAAALCCALLRWFEVNGRDLEFRRTADPYAVLVSEVMLQQTQIGRIEPAWRGFLERFPTVEALAGATPADVLRQWGGLGYNRRAVNLHRAARVIVAEHDGRIPGRVEELGRLPGIGPYTARAVAAIAFGVPVAPIDTNVRRVLGRVLAGAGAPGDPGNPLSDRELQALADWLADRERPAAWTHAVMDLGSAVCRRSLPACAACPLRPWCEYPRLEAPAPRTGSSRAGSSRPGPPRAGSSRPGVPFEQTSRWLRGRIVACLRDAEPGTWVRLPRRIGAHDGAAVDGAIAALEREGLLEQDGSGRVRLPIA